MENNKSNQWELEGKCNLCRKQNYCSKPCTRNKRATEAFVRGLITDKMDEMSGGAFSEIMRNATYL